MSRPKFDSKIHRPNGKWIASQDTDITRTWDAERKRIEADRKEREAKVQQIRKIGTRT